MDYDTMLAEKYGNIQIDLVSHDQSPTGLPAYIECRLGSTPKDKGQTVLDLSNYLYRTTGLKFQMCPEYDGRGKKTVLKYYMTWENIRPIIPSIRKSLGKLESKVQDHIPYEFSRLTIQGAK